MKLRIIASPIFLVIFLLEICLCVQTLIFFCTIILKFTNLTVSRKLVYPINNWGFNIFQPSILRCFMQPPLLLPTIITIESRRTIIDVFWMRRISFSAMSLPWGSSYEGPWINNSGVVQELFDFCAHDAEGNSKLIIDICVISITNARRTI